jgi:nicotinic acid mononucleotide adenylyltransferase
LAREIDLPTLEKAIEAIHAAPQMFVIEFAGAGSQALTWLHSVGGSSRTILEATDRYTPASLIGSIGFEPEQFTSPEVAKAMATQAFFRACDLAKPGVSVAGLGCTATIATDRTKRGDHRCFIATCEANGITSYGLTLTKGLRTRRKEENVISLLILSAIAEVCGLRESPVFSLSDREQVTKAFEPCDLLDRLSVQELDWVVIAPNGQMTIGKTLPNLALLPGACDPLHEGQRQLARAAAEILGQEIYFELSLVNAGKGQIELELARRRLAQFAKFATVMVSRTPLYSQKAELFPHSVFVIGADKVKQLFQKRYYNNDPAEMDASFDTIRAASCRFLVGGRLQGNRFLTLKDLELPQEYRDIFEEIPAANFRVDISSTDIRQQDDC